MSKAKSYVANGPHFTSAVHCCSCLMPAVGSKYTAKPADLTLGKLGFTSYLIFVIFLHGQNFWKIKFTPKLTQ